MKRIIYLLLSLILLTVDVKAFEVLPIDATNIYCQDYIGIISDDVKDYIYEKGVLLEDKTKAQIVVVTKNELKTNIYDFSLKLFNSFAIGDKEKNNGILLLFTTDTKEYQMLVGSGIDTYFSEKMCDAIINEYFQKDFEIGRYDQAVISFYDACFNELNNFYKVTYPEAVSEEESWFKRFFNNSNMIIGLLALVISAIITLTVFIYNRIKRITIKPNSFIEKGGYTNNYPNQYNRGYYRQTATYTKKSNNTNNHTAKVRSSYGGGKSKGIGSKH